MGILNVTPDSFSDGGHFVEPAQALERALQIQEEGADLLDLGAESSRPGAAEVSPELEWERLHPVLQSLKGQLKIPLSLDTRHRETLALALDFGVEILNDVTGAKDEGLLRLTSEHRLGYVLMHCRGTPQTMMAQAGYEDLIPEVLAELGEGLKRLRSAGVSDERICLDPGFGFAKTSEQGMHLLQSLSTFQELGLPLMVGLSRKRMLKHFVGEDAEALRGASVAAAALAIQQGANVLRVHDVALTKAALKTLQIFSAENHEP